MHKFRLFNPNGKKKYILKKTCQTDYEARKSKPWHDIYADESVDGVCNEFYRYLKTSLAK
ncbi:hypothetical protein [uncultured Campylobacter sp.]|uniref:hypothetical protein n=1 Tax=uncultured Campylobacter sp. TaxID=218934 RepID=UPI00262996B9|nr:hypothetical protein [uncultured Campylobacter sp.]